MRRVVAGVGLVLLATACSMEGRIRRRGAHAVCDASPLVNPWISRKAETERSRRFAEAVFRGSAGSVRTRPLPAAEVEALVGRVPIGYGPDVVVLEVLFVLTLGLVDVDDRWGSLAGGRAADPGEDTRAGRDAAMKMSMRDLPRRVEPGATVTRHLLVARTEGTGPVALTLELEPQPEGCLSLRRRTELEVTVAADEPSMVTFAGEDLLPLARW